MKRSKLDLDDIDAILDALGAPVGDDDEVSDPAEESQASPLHALHPTRFWWSNDTVEPSANPSRRPSSAPRRRYRPGARPSDIPPLTAPPGYRRDPRGTWRYTTTGAPVPAARDVTLDTLFRHARARPELVFVSEDEVLLWEELRWCRDVGDPVFDLRTAQGPGWQVPLEEWEDRASWPLGISAPELDPDRLVTVDRLARFLGGVSSSTITSYLARGRLPEPQVRIGGRPAWSAPVLLHWHRSR